MTDVGGGAGGGGQGAGGDGAEGFLDRARNALRDLAEVKVVTLVANVPIKFVTKGGATETVLLESETNEDAIITIVKLLDGDVTTVIAEGLVGNAELRADHAAQVAASLEVLPRNLKALVDIARSLKS